MSLHGWLRRFARTLGSLVRILAPAYVLVALLQASGLLEAFSVWLEVPLRLVGIGPEGVLPLMLGLFSALYAAIGSMASLGLAPEQALPVALFLSFAHALPVEVGVAARCRVNPWRMAAARVGMGVVAALAAPLLRPLLPPASGSGPAGAAHPAPLTEPALVVIGNSLLGLGKTWLLLVVILAPVTLAMEVLDGRGLIDRWSRQLAPRMAWLGFSPQAAFPILAGLFLGLVYGAGVIIDRMNKGKVSQREAWSMFLFLAACHSVLEDPFVFAAVGVGPQILLPVRLGAGVLVLAGLAVGTVRARRKAQAPPEGMRSAGSRRRAAVAGGLAVSLLAVLALAAAVLPGSSGRVWPGPRTSGEGPARSVELVVSAAASLADAAQPLKAAFEARHPGVRVLFNFGSSGALRHQIEQGAPVDVLISASRDVIAELVRRGLADGRGVIAVAGNEIVLVRPASSQPEGAAVRDWEDLGNAQVHRVGMGDPAHVPAGLYAKAVLEHLELWEKVRPKLALGTDVRQVLAYAAAGEVDAAIVYATDARNAPGVAVVARAPKGSHPPAVYEAAALKDAPNPDQARAFVGFLATGEARDILQRFGFTPPPGR